MSIHLWFGRWSLYLQSGNIVSPIRKFIGLPKQQRILTLQFTLLFKVPDKLTRWVFTVILF